MARIFITGSTGGLGLAAAQSLLGDGQEVVFHARSDARTRKEAAEVVTQLAFHAGWPSAMSALPVLNDVFDKRGG